MCVNINKRFQGKEKCQQVKLRAGAAKENNFNNLGKHKYHPSVGAFV